MTTGALGEVTHPYCLLYAPAERATGAYPSIADIGYLVAYPLMAAGLLLIVRRRTPGWDGASAIDAAIVVVSAAYLTYEFVIAPTMAVTTGNLSNYLDAIPAGRT